MVTKATRIQIKEVYDFMTETYGVKSEQLEFINKTNQRLNEL
jgi:hypothetical protein